MPASTILLLSSGEPYWGDVRAVLAAMAHVRVGGEATSVPAARHLAATLAPDLIIAAPTLGWASTLPLLRDLHAARGPAGRIVVLAARLTPEELSTLADAGIIDCWLWGDLSSALLRHCLDAVLAGDLAVSSRTAALALLEAQRQRYRTPADGVPLAERERTILHRLAEGFTREQIATAEQLSLRTVNRVVASVADKLDAPDPFVLGMRAAQLGLVG